ncbi:MAG TPA: RNA polymerase sigma factor [Polyangiaceae bacterium]|nr:RNA polymerase sigma factor [Polyangiaceae bacterium]
MENEHEEQAVTDAGGASAPAPMSQGSWGAGAGDEDILQALAREDRRRALCLCVERHGPSIGRLCMAMLGSQVDADDLTQETLLTAHQSFAEFRQQGSVRSWLLGIARNKCLQHLEKHRRRGARLRLVTAGEQEGVAGEDAASTRGRAEQARALLAQVRPSDRDALVLRYCGDLSFKEVAAACGIAEAAARKRVSRALAALRSAFGKEAGDE